MVRSDSEVSMFALYSAILVILARGVIIFGVSEKSSMKDAGGEIEKEEGAGGKGRRRERGREGERSNWEGRREIRLKQFNKIPILKMVDSSNLFLHEH